MREKLVGRRGAQNILFMSCIDSSTPSCVNEGQTVSGRGRRSLQEHLLTHEGGGVCRESLR